MGPSGLSRYSREMRGRIRDVRELTLTPFIHGYFGEIGKREVRLFVPASSILRQERSFKGSLSLTSPSYHSALGCNGRKRVTCPLTSQLIIVDLLVNEEWTGVPISRLLVNNYLVTGDGVREGTVGRNPTLVPCPHLRLFEDFSRRCLPFLRFTRLSLVAWRVNKEDKGKGWMGIEETVPFIIHHYQSFNPSQ